MTIPGTETWTLDDCLDYIDHGLDTDDGYNVFSGAELEMLKNGDEEFNDEWYAD